MSVLSPQWAEFLSCPVCYNVFNDSHHQPISLACSHTVCRACLHIKLQQGKCPFDHTPITRNFDDMPVNSALLQLVGVALPDSVKNEHRPKNPEEARHYVQARECIEHFAHYLIPMISGEGNTPSLSRPILKKMITLINCQLLEDEGRCRLLKIARAIGERTISEIILQHQNPQQLSANLWAAVRTRGCQFLGPAMQEEVLKLILLALEDGSALTRKVLVLFVVQRLQAQYPQSSKTAIGHVVQLLYRASCFMVTKREEESSLMQLKEEFRSYEGLRREHDAQIVQIATEAGLRIAPDQWSSLLYGDTQHKSHMQSIMDKLQTPQSFIQAVSEFNIALQRSGDPGTLATFSRYFEMLAAVDASQDAPVPCMEETCNLLVALQRVVDGLADFSKVSRHKRSDTSPQYSGKYKTSMCRNFMQSGACPRGSSCTFAHTKEEMDRHRGKPKKMMMFGSPDDSLTEEEMERLESLNMAMSGRSQNSLSMSSSDDLSGDENLDNNIHDPTGVSVPTMQAPIAPVAKGTVTRSLQSIYSCSSHVMTPEDHKQRRKDTTKRGTTQQHVAPQQTTKSHGKSVMSHQAAPNIRPAYGNRMNQQAVSGISHSQAYNVEDPYLRAVLMYTRHPYIDAYTGKIPGVEWGFKPAPGSMGLSPDEHLDELRHRREELLAQISRGHNASNTSEPDGSSTTDSRVNRLLYRSVSDTIAASLTTMPWTEPSPPVIVTTSASLASEEVVSTPSGHESLSHPSVMIEDKEVLHITADDSSDLSVTASFEDSEQEESLLECDDEFIPFEHTVVSKYGPISRLSRSKTRGSDPLQVTARQGQNTMPVTAVTPMERPYPITSPVPSGYIPMDHLPDPHGPKVASSLPTALLKPQLMSNSGPRRNDIHTLWAVQEHASSVTAAPGNMMPSGTLGDDNQQLNQELAHITQQIQSLQTSEDERLARELQTVEMDITETERKLSYGQYTAMSATGSSPYNLRTLPYEVNVRAEGTTSHMMPRNDDLPDTYQHYRKPIVTVAPQNMKSGQPKPR